MRNVKVGSVLVLLFFSLACTSLKNTKVTDKNKLKLMSRISQGDEITNEERHLLVEYTLRSNMSAVLQGQRPELPTGKTIGEMIEEQRKWDAQQAQNSNGQPQPGH